MSAIFSAFLAAFIILPLLGYILIFTVSKSVTRQHKRSVNLAVDFTTMLLILAVHFLIMTIWGKSYLWLIMIVLFVIAMTFTVLHWKLRGEVDIGKVFKGFWRFSFLLFLAGYLGLLAFGLVHRAALSVLAP